MFRKNQNRNDTLILSSSWFVEDNRAWFIDKYRNILFYMEMDAQRCEFETEIPCEGNSNFSINPRCIKYRDFIFCIPDTGESILVYQQSSRHFTRIEIHNPNHERLGIAHCYLSDDKIFAYSGGLKKLIEIDVVEKEIKDYISLDSDEKFPIIDMKEKTIYSLLNETGQLKCFDMIKKGIDTYAIPDIGKKYSTICCDGEKFWLSGYCREIYVWDRKKQRIDVLDDFPQDFGIYRTDGEEVLDCREKEYHVTAFSFSATVGKYVWFIPYLTSKILYVDTETYEIRGLEIEGEEETRHSILTRNFLEGKYILEYVRENQYLGIFSYKNKCMYEIDAKELTVEKKHYFYSESCRRKVKEALTSDGGLYENDIIHLGNYFSLSSEGNMEKSRRVSENAGESIHKKIMGCLGN